MITIKYKNDDNDQTMEISIKPCEPVKASGTTKSNMEIVFEPGARDDTEDPGGIMTKLLNMFGPIPDDAALVN